MCRELCSDGYKQPYEEGEAGVAPSRNAITQWIVDTYEDGIGKIAVMWTSRWAGAGVQTTVSTVSAVNCTARQCSRVVSTDWYCQLVPIVNALSIYSSAGLQGVSGEFKQVKNTSDTHYPFIALS